MACETAVLSYSSRCSYCTRRSLLRSAVRADNVMPLVAVTIVGSTSATLSVLTASRGAWCKPVAAAAALHVVTHATLAAFAVGAFGNAPEPASAAPASPVPLGAGLLAADAAPDAAAAAAPPSVESAAPSIGDT
jgi:hypothetical protein